jgi:hypothetical protein
MTGVGCEKPTLPENGAVNCGGFAPYAAGDECEVTCFAGFTASATSMSCNPDGSWSSATCTGEGHVQQRTAWLMAFLFMQAKVLLCLRLHIQQGVVSMPSTLTVTAP